MAAVAPRTHEEIEAQIRELQNRKANLATEGEENGDGVPLVSSAGIYMDEDIYGGTKSKYEGYVTSIAANDEADPDDDDYETTTLMNNKKASFTAPAAFLQELRGDKDYDPFGERKVPRIVDREDEYRAQRRKFMISPERLDPFADGGKTPDAQSRTYQVIMREQALNKDQVELRKKISEKSKSGELKSSKNEEVVAKPAKRRRWDQAAGDETPGTTPAKKKASSWDAAESHTPSNSRWDETPGRIPKGSETPGATPGQSTRMWDATPAHATPGAATPGHDTPGHKATPSARRNRWDETPKTDRETPAHGSGWAETPRTDRTGTDLIQETPTPSASKRRSRWDETPSSQIGNQTPQTPSMMTPMTPMTPITPSGVTPTGTKAMGMATPTPGHLMAMTPEQIQAYRWEREIDERNRPLTDDELEAMFPPGYKALQPPAGYIPIRTPARKLTSTPTPMAGTSGFFFQKEEPVKMMDAQPKGNLPLLKPEDIQYFDKLLADVDEESLSPDEQKERKIMKLLLKIKNGTPPMRKAALRQITDKAREFGAGPLFNQILPLLMSPTLEDQERHLLVKVIDRILYKLDDLVRPYVHKILVVIEPLLIDEDYYARVEGREIISNLAKAAGLATMISTMRPDIDNIDEYVRNTTARAFAVVASALGIPALLPFLKAVCRSKKSWQARHTGIKIVQQIAILMGCAILPHLRNLVEIIEHGKSQVVKQCCATDGVEPQYIKDDVLPQFFKHFWNHRMALDRRNYRQLVDTTVEIANKVGAAEIIHRIVDDLKDENEQYRKMVMETIEKIMANLGAADIDSRLEEQLIDGILYAFQEQTTEDMVMLNGFGTIVNALGKRVKPYLPQICGTILWRLNNKSAKVRQQAADLISRIAVVMKTCQEEKLMGHLGVVLYEYLGEEYPEVLGSILGALKAIVNVIGMHKMTPPIKDLLPRLTPILKNRHEKVQENCIDLVGRIADRGAEYVSAKEWMRICFELLELLKAHKKAIRRATVNTFGYIAKAIGPHDVLATLLNNLRVQERQNRVCTTVAIAIVAETCSPFTVLPALMNEYRVPELNVQNGVLKSLSFLFEYIGEMGKDYIYAVTPLLEDALMDRDLVHRQTACAAIQHMALGVFGFGCEDALVHLLNYVWPNIFETSPHLVQAFMGAVEGLRVALGPIKILQYCLQGLFHPARKVRDVYWKIYNTLYIGGQDSLVIGYPRIPDDGRNTFTRHELDIIL
ncbi:splicing factor 3B subunit 1 [Caerostris darwini]|uniref:Splicing factor 3B subunit 1 n=1 Tax=Caerostris darwini TaxID=1538125 RepID=A0AAV4WIQ6_9ARAC|nr:splicing factor 3B subunit 1 [Caerostris darwini]